MANERKKRKDSTYFKSSEPSPKPKPLIGRQWHKDLIDYCEYCQKEVEWEEAETFGPQGNLYHPECLTAYRRQLKSFTQDDPAAWGK